MGILRLPRGLDYSADMVEQRVGDIHLLNLIANLGQLQKTSLGAHMTPMSKVGNDWNSGSFKRIIKLKFFARDVDKT